MRPDHLPREPAQDRVSPGSQVRQLERKEKNEGGPRVLHPAAELKMKDWPHQNDRKPLRVFDQGFRRNRPRLIVAPILKSPSLVPA